MVEFCKRPHMKILLAPARSSRRDGKVSYITLLLMSSLTRGQKIEKYRVNVGPTCATWQATCAKIAATSASESAPLTGPANHNQPRQQQIGARTVHAKKTASL